MPPALAASASATEAPFVAPTVVSDRLFKGVLCAGLVGLVAWIATVHKTGLGPPLRISRTEAISAAQAELTRRGIKLPATFQADASVEGRPVSADRFSWQTAGEEGYAALLGSYLPNALWKVRFVSFAGDVAERAEEWRVHLKGDGTVNGVSHQLPEARAGATLTEADARKLVQAEITKKWQLDPAGLVEVSATSAKRPKRLDWTFVYRDPAVKSLGAGQARLEVTLAGDEVAWAYRFVFVPEEWERADRALQSSFRTGSVIKGVFVAGIFLTGVGLALVAWGRKKLAGRLAITLFCLLFGCMVVTTLNRWPATVAGFSTAQPLQLQQVMAIVGPLVGGLFAAGGIALLVGLVARWLRPSSLAERRSLVLGGGAGLAMAGGGAMAALLQTRVGPSWPNFFVAVNFAPWFASALGAVMQFFFQSTLLLFVFAALDRATAGWQRQRAAAVVLAFVVGLLLLLPDGGASVGLWLAAAAGASAAMVLVYVFVLRHDLTILPAFVGGMGALHALAEGLTGAYPGALPAAVLAAVTLLLLGWWTTLRLRQAAAPAAPASPPKL